MERYITLFIVKSESSKDKNYKIAFDRTTTTEKDGLIKLSCNCPAFTRGKNKGNCKHINKVWNEIDLQYDKHAINAFQNPKHIVKSTNKHWLACADEWLIDSPETHIGTVEMVNDLWKLTNSWLVFSSTFISGPKLLVKIRMCVSCDEAQKIPLDSLTFFCNTCGRKQRT